MDVKEFFELGAGKWFSQKTSHHLTLKQSEHGKSDLVIDLLPREDTLVTQLCQQIGIDPNLVGVGTKYTWKGTMQWDIQPQNTTNQQGAAIAILIPDAPGSTAGKLFRSIDGSKTSPTPIRYTLGNDDALTLVTEDEHQRSEERIWFESNNVRLRTTIVTQSSGDAMASFYSEIRMGG
jgi:CpeS-like protein